MGNKNSGRKRRLHDLPESNLRHITLEIDDRFQIYEDGKIFSRKSGKWLKPMVGYKGEQIYVICNYQENKRTTITVKPFLAKYFFCEPPENGIEHKPVVGLEDRYQFYRDGKMWSRITGKFLKLSTIKTYGIYCLVDQKKIGHSFYPDVEWSKYFIEQEK